MNRRIRVFALLFVFLFLFSLPAGAALYEDDAFQPGEDEDGDYKAYSYNYEEGSDQAVLHLHPSHAERGKVDLFDAFAETAAYGVPLYINLNIVKIYLTAKAVAEIAEKGEPVLIYVKKIVAETETGAEDTPSETEEDLPSPDVVYEIKIGEITFDYASVKIQVKYKTENAEALRVLSVDENGKETHLDISYGDAMVSFFPETNAFTLRITEEPLPEGIPKILVLLVCVLAVLVVLSLMAVVLLITGKLKPLLLRLADRRTNNG